MQNTAELGFKPKKIRRPRTPGEWILDIFKVLFLTVVAVATVYPFWNVFIVSINDATDAVRGGLYLWPRVFSLQSYQNILTRSDFQHSILITVARTVIGTPRAVLCTAMAAYSLSRKELVAGKFWNLLFVFTMYFGGGQVPYYMVLKGLGLLDNFWVFIFPLIMSVYNMILIKSYIASMPESLFEAVKIDGGNDLVIFFRFVLPLAKPILMTVALFVAITQWNSWFDNHIYTFRNKKVEPFVVTVEPKPEEETPMLHAHEGQELNFVIEGSMEFYMGSTTTVLNAGDSVYFNSGVPHAMRALNGERVQFLAMVMGEVGK